ncbi:MAG: hypothetical protein KDA62_04165 [Planctomycetales bacterium]|nr:hypothetical protein [Planctomycetales bacterium]
MAVHLFGIRHHGPGCARSLLTALDELRPDMVVIEGPADAEAALPMAPHEQMKPPVALLIYPADEPRRAVYYPMTVFSPEWQAMRWAASHGVPIRLMDLPQTHQLAISREAEASEEKETFESESNADAKPSDEQSEKASSADTPDEQVWRTDPLALLAEAAGYRDHELWWEEQIERRENAADLFAAILEAMRTVREETGESRPRDLLREAYMRKTLREVRKQNYQRIAVVCGAWHAPVLDEAALDGRCEGCRAVDDNARLKGLPKTKTQCTWIPWTHSRLTFHSGYGAGVHSPGWYEHLWCAKDRAATRWLASAARLLREKDLDASSASVIEAVRLADALAALRDLRSPGLHELNEAILTVLCHGDAAPMRLIRNRLEIGDVLGQVSEDVPSVPLAQDVAESQKRLRLKLSTEIKSLDLDVRKETDLARSRLLHRLGLLGIQWGQLERSGGRSSTFHEIWRLQWMPEYAVAIIEANVWGNTVEAAATARVVHESHESIELPAVTERLDAAILAGLDSAVDPLLARIQTMAAVSADVRHLLDALLPLARVARYGDVRGTNAAHVEPILVGLFERAVVGLAAACSMLDEDAANRMLHSFAAAQEALDVLNRGDLLEQWQSQLRAIAHGAAHGLLRGWCCRLLLEKQAIDQQQLYRWARLALSPANPPDECAAWATGLLRGSGLLLLHQDGVWQVFDRWLSELGEETFVEMLPLLRRAFADFTTSERRQMGEKVKRLDNVAEGRSESNGVGSSTHVSIHDERARRVLPVLAHILGVTPKP